MKAARLALLVLTLTRQAFAGTVHVPMHDISLQQQCAWPSRAEAVRIYDSEADWRTNFPAGLAQPFPKAPDWTRQRVIALTLGARPTTGFGIELPDRRFEHRGDVLSARFAERTPAPGDMQQQAFTQPCVFILVARGDWRTVVFRDAASGREVVGSVDAPSR
jgi:hypothetical protein